MTDESSDHLTESLTSGVTKDRVWVEDFLGGLPQQPVENSENQSSQRGVSPSDRSDSSDSPSESPLANGNSRQATDNRHVQDDLVSTRELKSFRREKAERERSHCEIQLQISRLSFQLQIATRELEETKAALQQRHQQLERLQCAVAEGERTRRELEYENTSLKQHCAAADSACRESWEASQNALTQFQSLTAQLENEKKLRRAVETEHRAVTANALERVAQARNERTEFQREHQVAENAILKLKTEHAALRHQLDTHQQTSQLELEKLRNERDRSQAALRDMRDEVAKWEACVHRLHRTGVSRLEDLETRLSQSIDEALRQTSLSSTTSLATQLMNGLNEVETSLRGFLTTLKIREQTARRYRQTAEAQAQEARRKIRLYDAGLTTQQVFCARYETLLNDVAAEFQQREALLGATTQALEQRDADATARRSHDNSVEIAHLQRRLAAANTEKRRLEHVLKQQRHKTVRYKQRLAAQNALPRHPFHAPTEQHPEEITVRPINPLQLDDAAFVI